MSMGPRSGRSGGQNFENPIGLRSERLVGYTVKESQTEPSGLKSGGPVSRVEVVEGQDRLEKSVLATQGPIDVRTDQRVERKIPGPQESGTVVPEVNSQEAARRQRLEKIIRRVRETSKMLRGMFSKRQLVVLDRLKPCEGGIPQSRKGALPERKNSFTAVLPTRKHPRAIVERNQRELRERELMCATGVFSVPRIGTGTGSATGSRSQVDSGLVIQRAADVGGILCDGNPRPTIQPVADAGGILFHGNPQPTTCKAEPRCAQTLRGPCPASKGEAQQRKAEVVARQTEGGPCLAKTMDANNQAQAVVKQTKGGPCFPGGAAADNQVKAVARQTQGGPCLARTVEADREVEGEAEQTPRGPCSAKTLEARNRPKTDLEEFILTDPLGSGHRQKHAEATLKFSMKSISEGGSDTVAEKCRYQARKDAAIAEPNPKERQSKCVTGTTGVPRSGTKAGGVTGSCSQGEGLLAGSQGSGPLRRTRTAAGNRYLMKPILEGSSKVIGDLHGKLPRIDTGMEDIWLQRDDAARELKQPKALAHSGGSPRLLRRTAGPDAHGGSFVWNEDCLPGCSWPATHEAEGGRHKRPHLEVVEDPAQRVVVPKKMKRRKGLPPEEVAWTPGEPPGKQDLKRDRYEKGPNRILENP
ncbi:uncharacterized protein [Leptinotarsa decemlineata]|uniref:uncharacterized protein n=1 Tax=Leptinotarsa decemlineata TaxID=7539 RepID=UPI003D306E1B